MSKDYSREDKLMSIDIPNEFGEGWLPLPLKIEVLSPSAMPGDRVTFTNYRASRNSEQSGVVTHVETHWSKLGDYRHRYTIVPDGKKYQVVVAEVKLIQSHPNIV